MSNLKTHSTQTTTLIGDLQTPGIEDLDQAPGPDLRECPDSALVIDRETQEFHRALPALANLAIASIRANAF